MPDGNGYLAALPIIKNPAKNRLCETANQIKLKTCRKP
jgi:hypothetical protein